jgi:hypothetical protein
MAQVSNDDNSVVVPIRSITKDTINVRVPHLIPQEALLAFATSSFHQCSNAYIPRKYSQATAPNLEHYANPVIHPITGETIDKYEKLANDPVMKEVWTTAFGKELGSLAQGDSKTGAAGTNTIFFMNHDEIKQIPKDRTVTYARVVVDYCPQKQDPNRV